jgi:hypothetical protein
MVPPKCKSHHCQDRLGVYNSSSRIDPLLFSAGYFQKLLFPATGFGCKRLQVKAGLRSQKEYAIPTLSVRLVSEQPFLKDQLNTESH